MKDYLEKNEERLSNENKEVFLLRNLSKKGIGFFMNEGFYPDFILWIKDNDKEKIVFANPKGIRNLDGGFKNDKVKFCTSEIQKIQGHLKKKYKDLHLELDAFILSCTKYEDAKERFRTSSNKEPSKRYFCDKKILFQKDSENYIEELSK